MAIEIKHICDKCKCEVINNDRYCDPEGWNKVTLNVGCYDKNSFTLCEKCQIELGIIKESGQTIDSHKEYDEIEELLDKLAELVAERIER